MFKHKKFLAALTGAAMVALTACSGGGGGGGDKVASDPVSGGEARIMQIAEPRELDPSILGNNAAVNALLGNALYGTLWIDGDAGEIEFKMAEDFSTADGGKSFTLALRPDLVFSDGSPLNAEAVKFNWERARDSATASSSTRQAASVIETMEVVDSSTLRVVMTEPVPSFPQSVIGSGMNWIASPAALSGDNFNDAPIGAGPFVLEEWRRQDAMELVRNDLYWDAPKPYLDAITLRAAPDANQRYNALTSGGVDLAAETDWANLRKADEAGLETDIVELSGGYFFSLNTKAAPFDDVRARRAVSLALDLDAINESVYGGAGRVPTHLFVEDSPFYSDVVLNETDPEEAQALFSELADEGKPVTFTFTSVQTTENRTMAESVQAQLSAFDDVNVEIEVVDFAELSRKSAEDDFEMMVGGASFGDPEPVLWSVFHSDSASNHSGIDDAELSASLDKGRTAETDDERRAAYQAFQERLVELAPVIFFQRASYGAVASDAMFGMEQYGQGSLLPEELWLQ